MSTHWIAPPDRKPTTHETEYGIYLDDRSEKIVRAGTARLEREIAGKEFRYEVHVMMGMAIDAGVEVVGYSDSLEEAAEIWRKWSNWLQTMVAVIDNTTNDQVGKYGYG